MTRPELTLGSAVEPPEGGQTKVRFFSTRAIAVIRRRVVQVSGDAGLGAPPPRRGR